MKAGRLSAPARRGGWAAVSLVFGLAAAAAAQPPAGPGVAALDLAQVARVVGPPRGAPLAGEALDAEAKRVGSLLRCPVCQGLSVTDSPTGMATNMRAQVREMLAAGFDEDQALSYFEASYGEFVRLEPPLRGVNWLVWLAPLLGLALGVTLVVFTLRRPRKAPPAAPPADAPAGPAGDLPGDPELARLVLRVREIAYGWPGGVRPAKKGPA